MRRLALLFASTAVLVFSAAPGMAASSHQDPGEESQAAADAADWFISQRLAPNGAVSSNALAAATQQAAALPSVAGDRWVAGRMTALAVAPNGALFAGAADGGVWKSTDGGRQWQPVFDTQ